MARRRTLRPSSIRTRYRSWVVEFMRFDTAFHLPQRVHCCLHPATQSTVGAATPREMDDRRAIQRKRGGRRPPPAIKFLLWKKENISYNGGRPPLLLLGEPTP